MTYSKIRIKTLSSLLNSIEGTITSYQNHNFKRKEAKIFALYFFSLLFLNLYIKSIFIGTALSQEPDPYLLRNRILTFSGTGTIVYQVLVPKFMMNRILTFSGTLFIAINPSTP